MSKKNKTLQTLALTFILTLTLGTGAIVATTININKQTEKDQTAMVIENDVRDYLNAYEIESEYIPNLNYLAESTPKTLSSTTTQTISKITKTTDTDSVVKQFDAEVKQIVNEANNAGNARLSQEQLDIITSGIEAICVSDIYKILSNQGVLGSTDTATLEKTLTDSLTSLQTNVNTQTQSLNNQMTQLKSQVNSLNTADASKLLDLQNKLNTINKQLQNLDADKGNDVVDIKDQLQTLNEDVDALKANSGTSNEEIAKNVESLIAEIEDIDSSVAKTLSDALKAFGETGNVTDMKLAISKAINSLVERSLINSEGIATNKNNINALIQDVSANKAKATADANNLLNTINTVNTNLTKSVTDLSSDTAVSLQGLSDEINNNISTQINSLDDKLTNDIGVSLNQAREDIAAVQADLDGQSEELQNLIDTANNDYTDYVNAVREAQQTAEDAIAEDLGEKSETGSGARNDIARDRAEALSRIAEDLGTKDTSGARYDIEQDRIASLSDIQNALGSSVYDSSSSEDQSGALGDIEKLRQKSMSDIRDISADKNEIIERIDGISDNLVNDGYLIGEYSTVEDSNGKTVYKITFGGGKTANP